MIAPGGTAPLIHGETVRIIPGAIAQQVRGLVALSCRVSE